MIRGARRGVLKALTQRAQRVTKKNRRLINIDLFDALHLWQLQIESGRQMAAGHGF